MAISVLFDGKNIKQLGTYVKTDLNAIRQVNGVSTGVVAFLGLAEGGLPETPYVLTSYADAVAVFKGGPLVDHIQAAFIGGAGQVVGVRLNGDGISSSSVTLNLLDNLSIPFTLVFKSLEKSSRTNNIFVQMLIDSSNTITPADDKLILNISQKNPDCSVYKEQYELPRFFSKPTVLVRRANTLSFVQDWVIDNALYNCQVQGSSPKFTTRVATTSNIVDLAAGAPNTVDGVTLALNDRVLVKNQTTGSQNGIYAVTTLGTGSNGTWTRTTDATTNGQILANDTVKVTAGTVNINQTFYVSTANPINIGTTAISFATYTGCVPAILNSFIRSLLQEQLLPTDELQYFQSGDSVPLGLLAYEVNVGNLFGFDRSRLVTLQINNESTNPFDSATLFSATPVAFFDSSAQSYVFPPTAVGNVVKTTYTLDEILTYNSNIISDLFALSGGSNGNDGTGYYLPAGTINFSAAVRTAWINGLAVLENEEVNFVEPAYRFTPYANLAAREGFFSSVGALILSHVEQMSQTQIRQKRTSILGYPAPEKLTTYDKTTYLSGGAGIYGATKILTALASGSDRIQAWVGPFQSIVFSPNSTTEILGGEFLASYISGKHANVEPQVSLTFSPVSGLGANFLYNWSYTDKDNLISQRLAFTEKVKNSFGAELVRIHHNPTAWLGAVTQKYQEFILRRSDDFLSTYIYKNVEQQMIGKQSFGKRTDDTISEYVKSLLSGLKGSSIVDYADVSVTHNSDNTVYYVTFRVQFINEIKFILITMQVDFSLA